MKRITCPVCIGEGGQATEPRKDDWTICRRCGGSGTVPWVPPGPDPEIVKITKEPRLAWRGLF